MCVATKVQLSSRGAAHTLPNLTPAAMQVGTEALEKPQMGLGLQPPTAKRMQ